MLAAIIARSHRRPLRSLPDYADPQHGFTLPPGRYDLEPKQDAGRVSAISVSPQPHIVPRASARALLLQYAAMLDAAGWQRSRDPESGAAAGLSTAQAIDGALDTAAVQASGHTNVGIWRVPRSAAPWAALPPGAFRYDSVPDGPDVLLTLKALGGGSGSSAARASYIVDLYVDDENLSRALFDMGFARLERTSNVKETLTDWDRNPNEPLHHGGEP